jgi:hypothetical protein
MTPPVERSLSRRCDVLRVGQKKECRKPAERSLAEQVGRTRMREDDTKRAKHGRRLAPRVLGTPYSRNGDRAVDGNGRKPEVGRGPDEHRQKPPGIVMSTSNRQ